MFLLSLLLGIKFWIKKSCPCKTKVTNIKYGKWPCSQKPINHSRYLQGSQTNGSIRFFYSLRLPLQLFALQSAFIFIPHFIPGIKCCLKAAHKLIWHLLFSPCSTLVIYSCFFRLSIWGSFKIINHQISVYMIQKWCDNSFLFHALSYLAESYSPINLAESDSVLARCFWYS